MKSLVGVFLMEANGEWILFTIHFCKLLLGSSSTIISLFIKVYLGMSLITCPCLFFSAPFLAYGNRFNVHLVFNIMKTVLLLLIRFG